MQKQCLTCPEEDELFLNFINFIIYTCIGVWKILYNTPCNGVWICVLHILLHYQWQLLLGSAFAVFKVVQTSYFLQQKQCLSGYCFNVSKFNFKRKGKKFYAPLIFSILGFIIKNWRKWQINWSTALVVLYRHCNS